MIASTDLTGSAAPAPGAQAASRRSEGRLSPVLAPAATAAGSPAYDWRGHHRMIPGADYRFALPLVDVALAGFFLFVAGMSIVFILDYGAYAVYVANLVLHLALAAFQPFRLHFLRTCLVGTYSLLALYALLVFVSPVNLGLSPIIIVAVTDLHAVTRWEPERRWSTAALLLALAGSVMNPVTLTTKRYLSHEPIRTNAVVFSLLCVGTVAFAYLQASRRRREAEDHARAVSAAAAEAIAAERLSLARELHDLVGHSLTAVKVQASTGLALGGEDRLREALETIRDTADSSLASVRQLVTALRSQPGQAAPLADLLTIPALIETARSAGARVSALLPDSEVLATCNASWSAMQRLTLVRLVGEALTNAVRHGAVGIGQEIDLKLTITASACHVSVRNPLRPSDSPPERGTSPAAGGNGLIGLEERLRLVGGRITHGPVTAAGGAAAVFHLDADFPVTPTTNRPDGTGATDTRRQDDA